MIPRGLCYHYLVHEGSLRSSVRITTSATIMKVATHCFSNFRHVSGDIAGKFGRQRSAHLKSCRNVNLHRQLGTSSSDVSGSAARGYQDTGEKGIRGGSGDDEAKLSTSSLPSAPYVLPKPSWSLADLRVVDAASPTADTAGADETAAPVLSREEVKKLCALAHIDLAPEGDPHGGLDVVAVQKDVGAMLRCMQTMRKANDDRISAAGEVEELDQGGGPWGDAAEWAAPLQADEVSDGNIEDKILGAARRTHDGFFIAPRVVGGEDAAP